MSRRGHTFWMRGHTVCLKRARVWGMSNTIPTTKAMAPKPMERSAPGTILKRLMPDPVSNPKAIRRGMVVTTLTIWESATAAAMEPSSTCWRLRYRALTATWPTVGGIATPMNAVESCTRNPRTMERRLGTNAARFSAAAK